MIIEQYYSLLGKYLYALANSDGSVQEKEKHTLDQFVNEMSAEFQMSNEIDRVRLILVMKMAFYNGISTQHHPSTISKSFREFLIERGERVSAADKKLGLEICEKIMSSYGGVSAAEEKNWNFIKPFLEANS